MAQFALRPVEILETLTSILVQGRWCSNHTIDCNTGYNKGQKDSTSFFSKLARTWDADTAFRAVDRLRYKTQSASKAEVAQTLRTG